MTRRQRYLLYILALVVALSCLPQAASAKDPEFDAIAKHIQAQYKARRRKIPFMGLANFAVKLIRPAGVKSIKVAIFEELNHVPAAGSNELSLVMRSALSSEWLPLVRIRSRDGEQIYVYARAAGESIQLMVVSIGRTEAVVARAKVNPQKLKEFLDNPKILGISLKQ
jgi:hypothetical protein